MHTINVQMNFDNNRNKYALVTLTSILENLDRNYNLNVYIIHYDVDKEVLKLYEDLKLIYKNLSNVYIYNFKDYLSTLSEDKKVRLPSESKRDDKYNYNALMIPLYLSDIIDADYVLHIDDDVIFNSSAHILWNYRSKAPYVGTYDLSNLYCTINSGVTIHNLKYNRSNNILNKYIELSKVNNYRWFEQDLWNIVYKDNNYIVSPKFNWASRYSHHKCNRYECFNSNKYYNISKELKSKYIKDFLECKDNPDKICIIHYSRSSKPWNKNYHLRLKNYWIKYNDILNNKLYGGVKE